MQLAAVAAANIVNRAQKQPLVRATLQLPVGVRCGVQVELETVCVSGDMHKMHVVYEQLQTISLA